MQFQRIEVHDTSCYPLQGEGGIVLIDPGPPSGLQTVIRRAAAVRVQPGDIHLILISHGHVDHYGAAAEIKAWCGAPVAAYPGESEFSTVFLPGHSPGSLGILTAARGLLVDGLFVNYAVPSQPICLSDREAWQRSYEHVQALAPHAVYVGH